MENQTDIGKPISKMEKLKQKEIEPIFYWTVFGNFMENTIVWKKKFLMPIT